MKWIRTAIAGISFLAFLPFFTAEAVPTSEVTVSSSKIALDEAAQVEIRLEWRESEGSYRFLDPTWKLQNITFVNSKVSNESFIKNDIPWNRTNLLYEFKADQMGKASISDFKIRYFHLDDQKPGSITIARIIQFEVKKAKNWGPVFGILSVVFIIVLIGGLMMSTFYAKFSVRQSEKQRRMREQLEYDKIESLIKNPIAKLNKDIVYEWSRRFYHFLIFHYHLVPTLTAEIEITEHIKNASSAQADLKEIQRISREISRLKYSQSVDNSDINQLQKALLQFIQGKRVQGAV